MSTYSTGDTTKSKMINAAGELAAELGIDNVSTRAVAEASGENIGSIHYHFGSKSGLFEAMACAAIGDCHVNLDVEVISALGDSPTRKALSKALRELVVREVSDMFRSDRPGWHPLVIYQLLQRDDALYEMFRTQVLDPSIDHLTRFFRMVDPSLSDDEVFVHITTMKMPIFAHANYKKTMLKRLGQDEYSDEYLVTLENVLVRQAQLVLGLPEV